MKALFASCFLAAAASAQSVWTVGQPLPHVHLPSLEGEEVDLASFRGTKLLLIEFASW